MITKFLCGCDLPSPASLLGDPELKTLAMCSYDDDGFLVCTLHRQRRYGWRSVDPGAKIASVNWELSKLSPLQRERVLLFDEVPEESVILLVPGEDRRDNRDPTLVYTGSQSK